MGLFSIFFQRPQVPGVQPHTGWRWSLSVNGLPTTQFDWEDVAKALDSLGPHDDSYVILEQKQGKDYWFIQSAIALQGPNKDDYIVGIGWSGETGPVLMERCYHWKDLDTVIGIFEQAFQRKQLDLSGYENFFD